MMDPDYLRRIVDYDPSTGKFTWKIRKPGVPYGKEAGSLNKSSGYRIICIDRVWHRAHRLAFVWMTGQWPVNAVDHINRNRSDNRWENLREASHAENCVNIGVRRSNKSGYPGVSWDCERGKWLAQIRTNGKKINLGRFDSVSDAANAWLKAASCDRANFRGVLVSTAD